MEFDENSRKPEDQEVEKRVRGGNRNLKGWLSHRLFLPLGGAVASSRAQATLKLRMMIRTPDPVSDNQDSDAVGLNYTFRHRHESRRVAPSETRSRLCI